MASSKYKPQVQVQKYSVSRVAESIWHDACCIFSLSYAPYDNPWELKTVIHGKVVLLAEIGYLCFMPERAGAEVFQFTWRIAQGLLRNEL